MADIKIPIDTVEKVFEDFLVMENNSRVFFSGPFGIGKTFFLNEFFESRKDKYDVFHLYPINYQINSNEDILELIKYDILVELLKKNKDILQGNKVDGIKESALLFYSWARNRFTVNSVLQSTLSIAENYGDAIPDPISSSLTKLGRPLKDLLELDKEFQEFKHEYKGGEKALVEKYVEQIKAKNISETDFLSHLLKEKITLQKDTKKSILVLDDLDRIDPEHVFRILNILSAYFEKEHENKFGFDLIVIVADYTNLKNFFHHKYGAETDFSGYMDKFFTVSPFYFDNKKAILATVEQIAMSIKNEEPNLSSSIGNSGYIKLFLWHIFSRAINSEIMNLRSLLKATRFQLLELKKGSYHEDHFADSFQKIFDIAVKVTIHSFSNTDVFLRKLEIIKNATIKMDQRMPYGRYSVTMLKSFGIKVPDNTTSNVYWGKYLITKDESGRDSIKVAEDKEEEMFYNLLIEYVKQRKYIKSNYGDYEN